MPSTAPGYLAPVADEAGRTGRPPTDDGAEVTRGRYAMGEFTITPRSALDDERPPGLLGGRYEVGRLIGSGGTARVYRAYDVRLTREVAVKIYDRDAVALDQRRRLREMTIQGSISHPGVVALLDSGTENGRTYLVMQLVEGENLAERLLGGPMPAADVTALADGLAEALAHVHAQRIVHRDLKPANVFLSADGPLIGDFGIAHALDTTHITGTGLIPGTAAYLAPEQVSGEPAGPPADVYALGLILLECLTGQREYPGTMVEAAMARLTRPPRIPDDAPATLAYTLRRMTQREPADRPTAAKVLDMLHAPPPTLPWSRTQRSPRWRRRAVPVAGAAGGDLATAAGSAGHASALGPAGDPASVPGRATTLGPAGDPASVPGHASALGPADDDLASGPGSAGHAPGPAPAAGDAPATVAGSAQHDTTAISPARDALVPAAGVGATLVPSPTRRGEAVASSPAENPNRRRWATVAGLTAAAVAAAAAMVLFEQGSGTGSPAQPAVNPPAASATPASSTPLADSGTAPHSGSGSRPSTGGPEPLEPAAVTHENPATTGQPPAAEPPTPAGDPAKQGKPPKTDPPGKTKGKGPGHDS
ncbi:serine/threonine protein kinase [Amycolatopsis bullii]|uniref:non-specific serine/threonine protein kinase n=1 Tax=Amycolatopsis bullii TaxID=941987 RepID=A0ABQ3KBI6_9PSEU|nr:serine/threonine protein kinase [Amycolatopsis bullii]